MDSHLETASGCLSSEQPQVCNKNLSGSPELLVLPKYHLPETPLPGPTIFSGSQEVWRGGCHLLVCSNGERRIPSGSAVMCKYLAQCCDNPLILTCWVWTLQSQLTSATTYEMGQPHCQVNLPPPPGRSNPLPQTHFTQGCRIASWGTQGVKPDYHTKTLMPGKDI